MKIKEKILFTDLDGTLLDDQKNISRENIENIETALRGGHKIVVTTGRPLVSAIAQSKSLGLAHEGCYAISFNGSCIYDFSKNKVVYSVQFPREYLRIVFDEAHKAGLHVQTYCDHGILSERENESLKRYSQVTKVSYEIVDDVTTALDSDPYKIIVMDYHDKNRLYDFQDHIAPMIEGKLQSFFSCDWYLEFTAPGISKGNAVRHLCQILDIPLENSVAVGDAENDIAMLDTAAVGAVMSNAENDIKQHGNYITEADNNHSGVAEVIRKFILSPSNETPRRSGQ